VPKRIRLNAALVITNRPSTVAKPRSVSRFSISRWPQYASRASAVPYLR
jgi:hypothetical protein